LSDDDGSRVSPLEDSRDNREMECVGQLGVAYAASTVRVMPSAVVT
jgi:hypothetical protein